MKSPKRYYRSNLICLLALPIFLPLLFHNASRAADNSTGPTPDVARMCEASATLCQESCAAAKYTAEERTGCSRNCQSIHERCLNSEATRGTTSGEVGTGGVLMQEDTQKKKRKKVTKKP